MRAYQGNLITGLVAIPASLFNPLDLAEELSVQWPWFRPYLASVGASLVASVIAFGAMKQQIHDAFGNTAPQSLVMSTEIWITWGSVAVAIGSPLLIATGVTYVTFLLCALVGISTQFSRIFSLAIWSQLPVNLVGSLVKAGLFRALPSKIAFQINFTPLIFMSSVTLPVKMQIYLGSLDIFLVWAIVQFWCMFAHAHRISIRRVFWLPMVLHSIYAFFIIKIAGLTL